MSVIVKLRGKGETISTRELASVLDGPRFLPQLLLYAVLDLTCFPPRCSRLVFPRYIRDGCTIEQLRQSWVSTDRRRRRKGVDDMPAQLVRAVGTEAIVGHHSREPPPPRAGHSQDRYERRPICPTKKLNLSSHKIRYTVYLEGSYCIPRSWGLFIG